MPLGPELAGLYAVFTHVSRHEPAIAVEGFSPWRPRAGGIVGSVLAVVAVAALIASAFLLSRFGRVGAR